MRRYAEVIDVRGDAPAQAPDAFLWRDQVYLVRAVVGHWRERRAWWAGSAARALHGEETDVPAGLAGPAGELDSEHDVWRVEASRGRGCSTGVYDLCQVVDNAGGSGVWRLVRVAD